MAARYSSKTQRSKPSEAADCTSRPPSVALTNLSISCTGTPLETPTTRIANFMYFDQAALISSVMIRRKTLSIGFVNSHITANDTPRATAKVANSNRRNMTFHLWDSRSIRLVNENARGWKFYYKRFRDCFLVHRIPFKASAVGDSFVR